MAIPGQLAPREAAGAAFGCRHRVLQLQPALQMLDKLGVADGAQTGRACSVMA